MEGSATQLPRQVRYALEEVTLHFRHRLRVRGLVRFAAATLAVLAAGTLLLMLAAQRDSEALKNVVLAGAAVLELAAAWRWLIRPARMPIPAKQVALYIDEKFPELENRLVSAIEFARTPAAKPDGEETVSLWMIEKLLEETNVVARKVPLDRLLNDWAVRLGRAFGVVLLVAALGLLAMYGAYWAPDLSFLGITLPTRFERLPFSVKPGDAEVRKGDNLVVLVETELGNTPAAIAWSTRPGEWETASMEASPGKNVHHYEFRNIQEDRQYRVQSGRHRSKVFTITAWEPPRVEDIHLSYHFPEYLNRPAEEMPNGGPITAVEGTRVGIAIGVNKALKEATLVLDSGERVPLAPKTDAVWTGEIVVERNDQYRIEVTDEKGRPSDYEPVYAITAIPDKAPQVKIAFPRGDDEVTPLEEIPFAIDVTDDFGVAAVGIQYEVAGREPVRVALAESAQVVPATHGEHLLMLEDLGLSPGDLVTWTVWTRDQKPDRDPYETLGDPYFLEVRPFERTFQEAVSNAGANQAQQQGAGEAEMTGSQRDVLIATWNLRRTAGDLTASDFNDNRDTIVEAQEGLLQRSQEQQGGGAHGVPGLPGPHAPGAGEGDAAAQLVERLIEAQQKAVEALTRAEHADPAEALSEAMIHEQEAYSLLKKLEPREAQVQQGQGGGQGQGQSRSSNQREIDQLELARNRNFYEEEQLTRPPNAEAAEKTRQALQELAQRQQIANDEMARLISEMQQAKTEEERQEIERRLKRLEEEIERNLEQLDRLSGEMATNGMDAQQAREAQQGLSEARREMNRSLEEVRRERLQQARAAGGRAANALGETQRDVAGMSTEATAAGLRAVRERMAELEERQESILDRLEQLKERASSEAMDDLQGQEEEQESLIEEKKALAEEFRKLMEEAGQLAAGAQENQALMARKLNDWLRETSGRGILETMEETEPLVDHGIWDPAIGQEERVLEELQIAGRGLGEVEDLLVEDEVDSLRLALQQLRGVLNEQRAGEAGERAGEQPGEATAPGQEPNSTGRPQASSPDPGDATQPTSPEPADASDPTGGQQPGEQQGQPQDGQQGGQQGGQQSAEGGQEGAQPGAPGGGQQAGGDRSRPDGGTASPADGRWAGDPRGGNERGGGGSYGGYGPEDLGRFVESDYTRWVEALRNAEDLLPEEPADTGRSEDVSSRQRLARAREAIGEMRRDYRGSGVAPQYEGFIERVVQPMQEAAAEIDRRLQELLQENEFALDPRVGVPPQYKERVAEYFRALSEAEAARE